MQQKKDIKESHIVWNTFNEKKGVDTHASQKDAEWIFDLLGWGKDGRRTKRDA